MPAGAARQADAQVAAESCSTHRHQGAAASLHSGLGFDRVVHIRPMRGLQRSHLTVCMPRAQKPSACSSPAYAKVSAVCSSLPSTSWSAVLCVFCAVPCKSENEAVAEPRLAGLA